MQEGPSITITNSYSHRMEPVLISAQSAANTIYNLGYDFHYGNGDNGTVHQVVNYKNDNRTQNFTYDALNRIQTAYTNGPNWGEQYSIDTWGNMTTRSPVGGKTMYEPLNVGQATTKNQFSTSSGFAYDADGNMTKNGGEQYTYDAEDRLTTADGYTYYYDGDGERVLKLNSSGDGILYSNGVSGTAVEEDTPDSEWVYLFFNGQRVARVDDTGTPNYYMSDHLGSLGVVTDESGDIVQESDYYPYGGEIVITAGNGSGADNYKFTGKERDNESGLDNFGARYDSSALGRFMTPDWAARATAVPYAVYGDPQSLNLYGYVRNDPVSNADGHDCTPYNLVGSSGQGTCPSSEAKCNDPKDCSPFQDNKTHPGKKPSKPSNPVIDPRNKKSKIPARAVIKSHYRTKNGAASEYTYQLVNAAGKKLKGDGYATEEHVHLLLDIGNANIKYRNSEGTFVPSANGEILDKVGFDAPLPENQYNFSLLTQTFTISYQGQEYDLTTRFVHIIKAVDGEVPIAGVGVVVP